MGVFFFLPSYACTCIRACSHLALVTLCWWSLRFNALLIFELDVFSVHAVWPFLYMLFNWVSGDCFGASSFLYNFCGICVGLDLVQPGYVAFIVLLQCFIVPPLVLPCTWISVFICFVDITTCNCSVAVTTCAVQLSSTLALSLLDCLVSRLIAWFNCNFIMRLYMW